MAHTDVSYTKVGWLNTPSTSTPINATNLGNMDDGIEACASRANASVPFDNILSLAEAQSVSVRGTYVLDVVDSAKVVGRIGTNTITYEDGDYYIKNDSASVKKKLLNNGLVRIGSIANNYNTPYSSLTFTVTDYLKSKVTSANMHIVVTKAKCFADAKTGTITLTPSLSYNSTTGVVTVSGLKKNTSSGDNDYEIIVMSADVYCYI